MGKLQNDGTGPLFILAFVFIASIQDVYLGNLFQKEDPIVVMVVSFLITFIFYISLQFRKFDSFLSILKSQPRNVASLNVTTTASWLGLFLALKLLEPAVVGAICFSLGPVLTTIFWKRLRGGVALMQFEKLASVGIALGLVLILVSSFLGLSGIGNISPENWLLGALFSALSAVGVIGNTFFSKRLSEAGAKTDTVMALRFPLLIVVGALLLPFSKGIESEYFLFFGEMFAFTALTIIMPLFILQKGIERSEPITVSLLLSSIPVVVFFIELADSRIQPSAFTFTGVCLCVIFASTGILLRFRKEINIGKSPHCKQPV